METRSAIATLAGLMFVASATAAPPLEISTLEADAVLGGGVIESVKGVYEGGDVDGDGVGDILISAEYDDDVGDLEDLGRVYVVSGTTLEVVMALTGNIEGEKLGGRGAAAAGDVDLDGYGDFLVTHVLGTPVRLYSGRTGASIRTHGNGMQTRVHRSPGDVDDDGFIDHMTAGLGNDTVFVFSGETGTLLHDYDSDEEFGVAAGPAGDVNGDGIADFMVGAPKQLQDDGRVVVYDGPTGAVLFDIAGTENNAELGEEVGCVGDINRDGFGDFAGAARLSDGGGRSSGTVIIYSGEDASVLRTIHGPPGDRIGAVVLCTGDMTGDGVAEYIVSADQPADDFGYVELYSGRTGSVIRRYRTADENDRFGADVALVDLDVDGLLDLVVAACNAPDSGRAYVFMTPAEGLRESPDLDGDGVVGAGDLVTLIGAWGPCPAPPDPCMVDLDGDGEAGVTDLIHLLECWTE